MMCSCVVLRCSKLKLANHEDGLTGAAWGDWALYTASPLCAFDASTQLGVQDPVGFWDPAGYMKDGDQATFNKYRSIELKHGRIAMLATMGYITPEVTMTKCCLRQT